MTPSTRAEICRAALCKAGRADLAAMVGTNRVGDPMRPPKALLAPDAVLMARAFRIAYTGEPTYTLSHDEQVERFQGVGPDPFRTVDHWSPMLQEWCSDYCDEEWLALEWNEGCA